MSASMGEVMRRGEMRVVSTVVIPGGNRKVVCGKYGDYFQVDQVDGQLKVETLNEYSEQDNQRGRQGCPLCGGRAHVVLGHAGRSVGA